MPICFGSITATHHPSTTPWSTNQVSFLLDSTVFCRWSQLYSYILTIHPQHLGRQTRWASFWTALYSVGGVSYTRIYSPSIHDPLVDEPGELPFGQHCILQVESAILIYTHHPSTTPWSTNQVSFLLDSTVFCRFCRLYSYILTNHPWHLVNKPGELSFAQLCILQVESAILIYTHHPSMTPWSTNQVSVLLDSTVFWKFSWLYSPAIDNTLVNKPGELPFGQHCIL